MNVFVNNIQFNYEYRDAGNNHQNGWLIFTNPSQINDLTSFDLKIRRYLFDEEYFYPYKLKVPSLHFEKWDHQLDHDWYRFLDLEYTDDPITDTRSFDEFFNELKLNAKRIDI